jgi:hypothetical protein
MIPVFITKIYAQKETPKKKQKSTGEATTIKTNNKDGVPQELIDYYEETIKNAKMTIKTRDGKEHVVTNGSKINSIRMDSIYYAMSKEQRAKATKLKFIIPSMPMVKPKKISPTDKQYELWKRPDLYGVWIDDKKINNSELNNYQPSDFVYYTASPLTKNNPNYNKYKVQLNLYTSKGYDKTYGDWANSEAEYYKQHYYRKIED